MMKVSVTDRNKEQRVFELEEGERILHKGLMEGLELPYECATGTCSSCRATLVSGDITNLWAEAPGAKKFRKPTDVLMCQITANSDLELSVKTTFTPSGTPQCDSTSGYITVLSHLTPEVALFRCTLDKPLPYEAGQFALIEFEGIPGPRAYSMIDYKPDLHYYDFLIRKFHAGKVSEQLFDQNYENLPIKIVGPLGKAVFRPEENRPFIAIAGGSGIAGILSILARAEGAEIFADKPSKIFFGLRDENSAYLLDELNEAVDRINEGLKVIICFSEQAPSNDVIQKYPSLEFRYGFVHDCADQDIEQNNIESAIDNESLNDTIQEYAPLYFVAGPPVMVDAAMKTLIMKHKISPMDIRYDKFG